MQNEMKQKKKSARQETKPNCGPPRINCNDRGTEHTNL